MKLGATFKVIRKNKGLKQTYFTRNNLTQSMISYFENNRRGIEAENLIFLLNKLNISFDEFEYISNNYQPNKKRKIIEEYFSIKFNNINKLNQIIKDCNKIPKEENDILIENISIICKALIALSESNDFLSAQNIVKTVWRYYENYDQWYLIDLRIINSILFLFSENDNSRFFENLECRIEKYQHFPIAKELTISLKLNISILLIMNQNWEAAKSLLETLLNENTEYMTYRYLSLSWYRLGICYEKMNLNKFEVLYKKTEVLLNLFDDLSYLQKLKKEQKTIRNISFEI